MCVQREVERRLRGGRGIACVCVCVKGGRACLRACGPLKLRQPGGTQTPPPHQSASGHQIGNMADDATPPPHPQSPTPNPRSGICSRMHGRVCP